MKILANKLSSLLPKLEQFGVVYLFALFEREDAAGKWDVVFSSQWSDKDAASAVRTISKHLVPLLDPSELAAVSRVVIIPSGEPAVRALASAMHIGGGCVEVVDCNFMGLQVKHAFVLKSQAPPIPQTASDPAVNPV